MTKGAREELLLHCLWQDKHMSYSSPVLNLNPSASNLFVISSREFRPRFRIFCISSSVLIIKSPIVSTPARFKQLKDLIEIADYLINNAYSIKEKWISEAYAIMYKIDKGIPPEEVIRQLKSLFGII